MPVFVFIIDERYAIIIFLLPARQYIMRRRHDIFHATTAMDALLSRVIADRDDAALWRGRYLFRGIYDAFSCHMLEFFEMPPLARNARARVRVRKAPPPRAQCFSERHIHAIRHAMPCCDH